MIHLRNFKVSNQRDVFNFFQNPLIFGPHQLLTGNALSTYHKEGKLFKHYDVLKELSNAISEQVNLPFMDMWANLNPPGTYVKRHNHYSENHPNSLVGVYYLHKPENSGNLIIEDHEIDVQQNDLIFFKDTEYHWTLENKSLKNRITISFNML